MTISGKKSIKASVCGIVIWKQKKTAICKNALSVSHILLECPITTQLVRKNGYDFNACDIARDILYITDVVTSVIKLIVHGPAGKLI